MLLLIVRSDLLQRKVNQLVISIHLAEILFICTTIFFFRWLYPLKRLLFVFFFLLMTPREHFQGWKFVLCLLTTTSFRSISYFFHANIQQGKVEHVIKHLIKEVFMLLRASALNMTSWFDFRTIHFWQRKDQCKHWSNQNNRTSNTNAPGLTNVLESCL